MSDIKLKPCPFCGREAKLETGTSCMSENFAYVICGYCHAATASVYNHGEKLEQFYDKAVELWNRRAESEEMTNENTFLNR